MNPSQLLWRGLQSAASGLIPALAGLYLLLTVSSSPAPKSEPGSRLRRLKLPRRWEFLFDVSVLFLLAAILIKPLFRAGYLDKWGSIESSLIADARFLIAH
jgi:hypothetical protein